LLSTLVNLSSLSKLHSKNKAVRIGRSILLSNVLMLA